MDKKSLSESDICAKFITPALVRSGWDESSQIRREVSFTNGRILVRGKMVSRDKAKRADYILYVRPNQPLAVFEAKDNNHGVGEGIQKANGYAHDLDIPFVFSSNGDGFRFLDRTVESGERETDLTLEQFPPPANLWERYCAWKKFPNDVRKVVEQPYYADGSGKEPRYYQVNAVNAAVEAVAKVDELMALVDRLEAKIVASREAASRLLEAMVAELSGKAAA